MATFKFLQIYQDRQDRWISCECLDGSGESWQEALRKNLKYLPNDYLYEIYDIFRFEDGNFESCKEEIDAERQRRSEIQAEKKRQQLLLEQEKNQEQEKALYLELKKKYG